MLTTLSILSFDQGPKFDLKLRSDVPEHLFEAPERIRRKPQVVRKPER
jgi:hypothetical protein